MACYIPTPVYFPPAEAGAKTAASKNDGYSIFLEWRRAYPDGYVYPDGPNGDGYLYSIGYNIYYSTILENVFTDGVKFVAHLDGYLSANILDLTPGETYYFAVRAFEYLSDWYNLDLLPDGFPELKVYPEAVLLSDITATDLAIPVSDIQLFPAYGIVQIGTEWIRYVSKDIPSNSLLVGTVDNRGWGETHARSHTINGWDGVAIRDPLVRFWKGYEEENYLTLQETANFSYPNYAYTRTDGYRTVDKDLLTSDLSASDASQVDFPKYDYAGWHRTNPEVLIRGGCIGTYIGGEHYCADGYLGVGRQLRGLPINEINHQREEMLLETTGEPVALLRRVRTGVRCSCYLPTAEYPEDRCPLCYGSGFVVGYEQYFNPRRSDGRILVRFEPATEDLKPGSAGLESDFIPNCWTLVVPAVKDRDVIVRYDEAGTRMFYYEILNVTRNKLFLGESGSQKFSAQRVRKTDPINQIKLIDDTSTMPENLSTSIGFLAGPSGTSIPHTHTVRVNEGIVNINQITQTTSVSLGHNHEVVNGVVTENLGHTHTLVVV